MKKIKQQVLKTVKDKHKLGIFMVMCMMMFVAVSYFTPVYADGLTDTAVTTANNINNSVDLTITVAASAVIGVGLLFYMVKLKKIGIGLVGGGCVCFIVYAVFQAGLLNWVKDLMGV